MVGRARRARRKARKRSESVLRESMGEVWVKLAPLPSLMIGRPTRLLWQFWTDQAPMNPGCWF